MRNYIAFLLCLFVLVSCNQPKTTDTIATDLQQRIDSLFSEFDNLDSPGYAIGISKEGETLYAKGYGAANLEYNIPIEPDSSAFSIASVSKQFTAACIALLILDEKLTLETSASEFIPELKKYEHDIKIKHLLYNTSGIKDYMRLERKSGKSWVTFNYFEVNECIEVALSEEKLQFKPGDRWDYCNVNFMLLAKIVEKVSGQSFSEFMKIRLFEPLKMNDSFINDDITQIIKNRVTPYNPRNDVYVEGYGQYGVTVKKEGKYIQHNRNSPHYGGSGVVSTINDLLKWCANMVNKEFGGQEFHDLMHKTIRFNHKRNNQAFGLYIGNFKGRKTVAWEGSDWGISSQMIRFPDQGIAIIVLSNLGSGDAYKKADAIADVLIDQGVMK